MLEMEKSGNPATTQARTITYHPLFYWLSLRLSASVRNPATARSGRGK
jgi:hypothetical protein